MARTKPEVLTVKQDAKNPEPLELIAQSIIDIANAWKKIQNSGLTKRAIVLLIQDADKSLTQSAISSVLDIVPRLADRYIVRKSTIKGDI